MFLNELFILCIIGKHSRNDLLFYLIEVWYRLGFHLMVEHGIPIWARTFVDEKSIFPYKRQTVLEAQNSSTKFPMIMPLPAPPPKKNTTKPTKKALWTDLLSPYIWKPEVFMLSCRIAVCVYVMLLGDSDFLHIYGKCNVCSWVALP